MNKINKNIPTGLVGDTTAIFKNKIVSNHTNITFDDLVHLKYITSIKTSFNKGKYFLSTKIEGTDFFIVASGNSATEAYNSLIEKVNEKNFTL